MAGALRSGYSGAALEKKLGIRENFRIHLIHAPGNYFDLFTEWPENVEILDDPHKKKNLIHFFTKEFTVYHHMLPLLKNEIEQNGMIWVSWPKKTSDISSDMSED